MNRPKAATRRAALAAFLLFAAGLLAVGPAEASRTTDARASLAAISATPLAPSSSLELVEPIDVPPRFGFAEDLGLLDPKRGPGGFVVFAAEAAQCELTYARNNPLKYVDPDGRDPKDTNLTLRVVINRGVVGSDMQDRIGEQIQHASGFFGERGIELDTKTYFGSFDGDEAFRSLDFDGRVRVGTGTSPIESLPNGPGSGSILAGFTNGSFMGRADVNRGRLLVGNRSNGFSLTHELIHIFLDRGVKQTTSSYLGREMVREPMLRLLRFFQNQKLQDGAKLYRKAESSCSDPKFVGPCK